MNRGEDLTATGWVLIIVMIVGLTLGVWWLLWVLWCWVLPQVWPGGPAALIAPGYWLFVGELCVVSVLGRLLFRAR